MLGIDFWELAIILLVALLVLGPEKPQVARQLGRITRELRRAVADFQANLQQADDDEPPVSPPGRVIPSPPAEARPSMMPSPTGPTPENRAADSVSPAPGVDAAETAPTPPKPTPPR